MTRPSLPPSTEAQSLADHWRTLERAFEQACTLDDGARRRWLRQLHEQDSDLAAQLVELLESRESADAFFARVAAQALTLAERAWQPGETVGPYRIVETLGAGGMGVVYRAHDERLARDVALKFLHPASADAAALKARFVDEARAASRLDHENICTVHEIAETGAGQVYIVMALCAGVDLAHRLAQGALRLDEILRLGLQMTDALAAAHAAGVLHRDLKPANLIVDDDGRLRLVDFGIATIMRQHERPVGAPLGTLSYMAPEQLRGEPLDARCDIWAVGVTLYEALTGQRPFPDAHTRAQVRAILQATPSPPASIAPGVPEALDAIVMRCLAPDPAARFASAPELREALRGVQQTLTSDPRAALAPAQASTPRELRWRSPSSPDGHGQHQLTVLLQRGTDSPSWSDTVARFGGRVVEASAPLRAAVFGYPLADEFAAQRALRCALALSADATLALASGSGWADAGAVVRTLGGTPFEAARALLDAADPGACDLAESTHALVRNLVSATSLPRHDASLPAAWRLQRAPPAAHRFEHAAGLTPFIGRVHESGLLREAWERSTDGSCETVLVAGEPGIGKSRLVHEFKAGVDRGGQTWSVACYCAPHQSAWSLHPLATGLSQAWLSGAVSPSATLDTLLREHGITEPATRQALRRLFNQPAPAGEDSVPLSPEALKEHTLDGLIRLLRAVAARRPVALVVEDLHWADPTTLEWMGRLRRDAPTSALLLVGTHRPGFRPTWGDAHDITRMALARLRRTQADALLSATVAGGALSDAQRSHALDKSDGNPLFIEEMAAALLDTPASDTEVPWTLRDALLSRLDRLGDAKAVAQTAAVIGREFDRPLLRAVQGNEPARTDRALQALEDAALVQRRDASREADWFKHALVRDTAYESLDAESRAARHRAVAEALLGRFAERAAREPALVAHHLQLGGDLARAAEQWTLAAQQALERFAIEEAQSHVQQGLAALSALPPSPATLQTELTLQVTLGPALMAARGYANEGVAAAYSRARELCTALGNPPAVLPALFGYWTYLCVSAQHRAAAALAQEMVELGHATPEPAERNEYLTEAYMVRGVSHYYRGELREAEADFETAFGHFDPQTSLRHILRYGQEAGMITRSYQVWNNTLLGAPERADRFAVEAEAHARASRHPFSIACCLNFVAWHALNRGRMADAERMLAENIVLCREQKLTVFLGLALALDAVRRVATGDVAGGSAALGEALALYNATGAQLFGPAWSGVIAQGHLAAGNLNAASAALDEAFATLERTDERWCLADLWRVRALCRGLGGDRDGATQALVHARGVVQAQGAVGWLPAIEAAAAQLGLAPA